MKYGLIGEKLPHSFSKEIHHLLADYEYELCELKRSQVEDFLLKRDFCGINVTIPYKQAVMEYLDFIDDAAKAVGAVNTVINKSGKLYGYNTDVFGFSSLTEKSGIDFKDKKVLILGGGGTSNTVLYAVKKACASQILRVSRTKKDGFITYSEALLQSDADIIINTTPVGMYPDNCGCPLDISNFKDLKAVFDVIYNPLKSRLLLAAEQKGIPAFSGLYMLIMQAYRSAELFTGENINISRAEQAYKKILKDKQNVVLVGMPSAGKTEIGKLLSDMLNMPFFDSDTQITKQTGKTPAEIINTKGEAVFRDIESSVIKELSALNNSVIATGGGAVLREENVLNLKSNGRVYYIDRPLELLISSPDRPLSSSKEAITALYENRKQLYLNAADKSVKNDAALTAAAEIIRKDYLL